MSNVKERIFYFDIIRALAIILVILVHTSKWFVDYHSVHSISWQFATDLGLIGNIGVQLFFMISGALLLNRVYNLKDFYQKRFLRILTPFLFWIIVIILFKVIFLNAPVTFKSLINIIFFEGFVWFIWVLMGLYLFLPVINSFINEYKIKGAELFLIFWIVTIILDTIGVYPIKNIELRYFSGYLGYMVLGWYLSNKEFNISNKIILIIGILTFIISSLIAFFFNYHSIPLAKNYRLSAIMVLQALGLYLSILYFAKYGENNKGSIISKIYYFIKDTKIGKFITSISICSYGMYLTHYFFIWSVIITNNTTHILSKNPFYWIPIVFISTVVFSWILIWVFSKIPYLKKVSGT